MYKQHYTSTKLEKRITYTIEHTSNSLNALHLISKNGAMELSCALSEKLENFKLTFLYNKDYLTSFGLPYGNIPLPTEKELCCTSKLIVFEILKTKYSGHLKNMFIESKAIELLLCVIGCDMALEDKCSSCKFLLNPYEKEKIFEARDILLNNLENPPIIAELALQVGINQCYLKKGFKDIYDTSIYAFVQEQRIIKAKLLLKNTNHSIATIAEMIGFSNPSNFSNAFKNYTGVLPSEIRNN